MVQPFEDAALKLKQDEVSDIVKSKFGYHIIKLTGREKGGPIPFKDVKLRIENQMLREFGVEFMGKWTEELKSKAKIEIIE